MIALSKTSVLVLKPLWACSFAAPLQLADAQGQYQQLQQQFEELKGDFQYNLQLLAERDAELEQADTAASTAAAELAAKANTIAQLQSQLAQAQSGEGDMTVTLRLGTFCIAAYYIYVIP
jgi:septal ring factor EnvC (AmiA/AmiB activator)